MAAQTNLKGKVDVGPCNFSGSSHTFNEMLGCGATWS